MIKDQEVKEKFIKYLEEHKAERFWQAVRNFSIYPFIFGGTDTNGEGELIDTFYLEDGKGIAK